MAKKAGERSDLLTKTEMDKLVAYVAQDLYFSTLYKVLRYSGRRIGEIYGTPRGTEYTGGIRPQDINFKTNEMETIILKTKKRKLQVECAKCEQKTSYKNAFCPGCGGPLPKVDQENLYYEIPMKISIPMRPELPPILKTFIQNREPPFKKDDFLFREFSLSYLKQIVKTHAKAAGIKKNFTLHGFRHYFVTQCKRSNMINEQIALWTGHKNPATLNIYNRMIPKDVEDKIMAVDL